MTESGLHGATAGFQRLHRLEVAALIFVVSALLGLLEQRVIQGLLGGDKQVAVVLVGVIAAAVE